MLGTVRGRFNFEFAQSMCTYGLALLFLRADLFYKDQTRRRIVIRNSFVFVFRNVLVKGGDLASSLDAVDIFFDGMLNVFIGVFEL